MRLRFKILLVVPVLAATVALACSNQSEGQPCDTNNGNNDCNDGLICVRPAQNSSNSPGVCCPAPPGTPTTSQCASGGVLADASPAPPDGNAEAASDAPSDGDGAGEGAVGDAAEAGDDGSGGDGGDGATDGATDGASDGAGDGASDAPSDGKVGKG